MGFTKVFNEYLNSISKQLKRRNRQGRENFTANENKAIEYYGKAAQQIKSLCSDEVEEGFVMREYVPQHMQFAPAKQKEVTE